MAVFFCSCGIGLSHCPSMFGLPNLIESGLASRIDPAARPGRSVQKLCRMPKPNKISPFGPRTGHLLSPWLPRLANRMLDGANVTAFVPSQKFDLRVKMIVRLSVFLQTVFINKESPFQINIFSFHRQHLACLLSNLKNNKLYSKQFRI